MNTYKIFFHPDSTRSQVEEIVKKNDPDATIHNYVYKTEIGCLELTYAIVTTAKLHNIERESGSSRETEILPTYRSKDPVCGTACNPGG